MLLLARVALAAVFAVAGAAKLADLPGARQAMRDFGVRGRAAAVLGTLIGPLELAVAAALLVRPTARWGALAALALLGVFVVAIVMALRAGRAPDCHCFGQLRSRAVGPGTLARNVALGALAAAIVVVGWSDPGASATGWIGRLDTSAAIALAAGVFLTAIVAAQGWLLAGMLRQQGRLMARIATLEADTGRRPAARPAGGPGGPRAAGLPAGTNAPSFALPDADGRPVSDGDLRRPGRPVLLIFSDPSCGACNALLPDIAAWQRRHEDTLTIAVITGGSVEATRARAQEHGLQRMLTAPDRSVFTAHAIDGTPAALLIDPAGKVAAAPARGAGEVRVLVDRVVSGRLGSSDGGAALTVGVGERLPSIRLTDAAGGSVDLARGGGRRRVLVLWDPQCPHCRRLAPELVAAQDTALGDLVLVVARKRAEVDPGLHAQVLLDPVGEVMGMTGAHATPTAIVLDADDVIASLPLVGGPAVLRALTGPTAPTERIA